MDELIFYVSSDEEEAETHQNIPLVRAQSMQRRHLRDHANILDIESKTFVKLFRLTKDAFVFVLDEIRPNLRTIRKSTAIPDEIKLPTALRFFAQGSYQLAVGEDFVIGLAQQTVSKTIEEVATAIQAKLCRQICDHNMMIRSVNACFGGASHDAHIWAICDERSQLKTQYEGGEKFWILGDSAYPLEPRLLTPYRMTAPGSPEAKYNDVHSSARNVIERTFGVLKARFRCLHAARELHYSPRKVSLFVNACCALHNVCIMHNVELPQLQEEESRTLVDSSQFIEDLPTMYEGTMNRERVKNGITNYNCD